MSIRFSRVTAAAPHKVAVFLVGGLPTSKKDLEPWTAFRDFTRALPEKERIAITVETFEYGEEETYDATPEEVAYIYMREERRPGFIEARAKKTGNSGFLISFRK